MKTKLTDKYTKSMTIYLTPEQVKFIDKSGKRSEVIRKLIDAKMEYTK